MYNHHVKTILNRARNVQGMIRAQPMDVSPTNTNHHIIQHQQRRHFASMMMIAKLRDRDIDNQFPASVFFRKMMYMNNDPWASPEPTRPVGIGGGRGRGGERSRGGGGGRGRGRGRGGARGGDGGRRGKGKYGGGDGGFSVDTFDSKYQRHPGDPTDDGLEIEEIEQLLVERSNAKRDRKFELADRIRDQLISEYGVMLNDRDRIWSTNSDNIGFSPAQDFGPTGHDYTLYGRAGPSISPLSEDSIHKLISERLIFKLNKEFKRADQLKSELMNAQIHIDDDNKLWRADGKKFLVSLGGNYDYAYAPDAGPMDSPLTEEKISELLRERLACKFVKDYSTADRIRDELKDAGVEINDDDLLWRADGQPFYRGRSRDDFDAESGGGRGGTTIVDELCL